MNHRRLEARNKLLYIIRDEQQLKALSKVCVYKYKNTTIYFYTTKPCRDREKLISTKTGGFSLHTLASGIDSNAN